MAERITIDVVNRTGQKVVFDTNILIEAFLDQTGPVSALMSKVNLNQRYTIDLVLWEFLRAGKISNDEIRKRREWLKLRGIGRLDAWNADCGDSFRWLLAQMRHRGSAVDGTLAACGLVNRSTWIIATNDADDFVPLKHVSLVHEFL